MTDPRDGSRRGGLRRDDRHLGSVEGADHRRPASRLVRRARLEAATRAHAWSSSAAAGVRTRRGCSPSAFGSPPSTSRPSSSGAHASAFRVPRSSTATSRSSSSSRARSTPWPRSTSSTTSRGSCCRACSPASTAGWYPAVSSSTTLGASDLPGWTGEWLGQPTHFAGFPPEENRRLLADAGLELQRDELVTIQEPEGEATFHWVLAQPMSCGFTLGHYRELLACGAERRLSVRALRRAAAARRPAPPPRRRSLARRGACGWPSSRRRRASPRRTSS